MHSSSGWAVTIKIGPRRVGRFKLCPKYTTHSPMINNIISVIKIIEPRSPNAKSSTYGIAATAGYRGHFVVDVDKEEIVQRLFFNCIIHCKRNNSADELIKIYSNSVSKPVSIKYYNTYGEIFHADEL